MLHGEPFLLGKGYIALRRQPKGVLAVHGIRLHTHGVDAELGEPCRLNMADGGDILVRRKEVKTKHLSNGYDHDNSESAEENINGVLRALRNLLVQRCGVGAIDISVLLRVAELSLEFRILVEVETTVPTVGHSGEDTDNTSWDGDHDYLNVAHGESVVDRDG